MNHKLYLGKVDAYGNGRRQNVVTVEIELREKEGHYRTIDLEEIDHYTELSIVGAVWNHMHTDWISGGQNHEEIAEFFPRNSTVQEIVEIWQRWHLNGMNAGTRKQRDYVDMRLAETGQKYEYGLACAILREADLLVDDGYQYGTAWLVEPLPSTIEAELKRLSAGF